MYSRYQGRQDFVPLDLQPEPSPTPEPSPRRPEDSGAQGKSSPILGELTGGLSKLLDGVLGHFSLEKLDTGDILLVLIILFLYLEGDNLELVITLGLMLLLGLGDD